MRCNHTWFQQKKDLVEVVNGLKTTRYFHQCPKCGKQKETVRADRSMPPQTKWKRELEKVIQRANEAGFTVLYETVAFNVNKILVLPTERSYPS